MDRTSHLCAQEILYHAVQRGLTSSQRRQECPLHPLTRMEDSVDATVFSAVEVRQGYYQVPIEEGNRKKTTFTSHIGTFRCSRIPFGIRNAVYTFQRALKSCFQGCVGACSLCTLKTSLSSPRNLSTISSTLTTSGIPSGKQASI